MLGLKKDFKWLSLDLPKNILQKSYVFIYIYLYTSTRKFPNELEFLSKSGVDLSIWMDGIIFLGT